MQEHQRLIHHALTQTAVRHFVREAGHSVPASRVMTWLVIVSLFIAVAADAPLTIWPLEMQRNMKPDDLPVQYMKGDFN